MKYTRILPVLAIGLLVTSCNSAKKLYEAREYDQVIQKVAPDACSGRYRHAEVELLALSYHKANQRDHDKIQMLKASGSPEVWPEIYQRYCAMKGRNEALSCLAPVLKKEVNYVHLNLDEEIVAARNKAESFLVAKCNVLLDSHLAADAEEAENYINQLYRTNASNSHIQDFRFKALLHSSANVLVQYENRFKYEMPEEFERQVLNFDTDELAKNHSDYYLDKVRGVKYDLTVTVVLQDVAFSPERTDAVTFKETKDGKTAEVTDKTQTKKATIKGVVKYYDEHSGQLAFCTPFEVSTSFKNEFSTISGDREACSEETLMKLQRSALPFPSEDSMLGDVARKLNDMLAMELSK